MIVFGRERDCVVHDENNIKGFFGEYRWLSNFEPCKIIFEGIEYGSTENAYQAAKFLDNQIRLKIALLAPNKSKRYARELESTGIVRSDWTQVKKQIMYEINLDKYTRNLNLGDKLVETSNKYLEETNWWNDTYWGVCNGVGQNNLGKILMSIRDNDLL